MEFLDFADNHNVFILGLVFLIDDLGFPFPSSTTLFTAAIFSAHSDSLSPVLLFFVCVFYAFMGNVVLYFWGRHGAKKWLYTHGHKFFLPQKRLEKFETFFEKKHGRKTIFTTSLITNVRPFMALMAGSIGMSPRKFFPFNILGIMTWSGTTVFFGYFYGREIYSIIKTYWQYIVILILLVIFAKLFFAKFIAKKLPHKLRDLTKMKIYEILNK